MARYIDADALREEIDNHLCTVSVCGSVAEASGRIAMKRQVMQDIDNAPTADVMPVVHGHWKKISPAGIYECSNCKQDVMTSDICVYNYCHMCGARMDEVSNDG